MPPPAGPRLSKSKYMDGIQCPKLLWWQVHEPEAPELEADPEVQFILDRGTEVGELARTYVPGGVLIDVPHEEPERRLRETAEALRAGAKVLYEAAIEHDGVMVLADILERGRQGWKLIEVKSTTGVKEQHYDDVAVQAHVLRGAGLEVRRAELMHLNRECRHPDLSNLCVRERRPCAKSNCTGYRTNSYLPGDEPLKENQEKQRRAVRSVASASKPLDRPDARSRERFDRLAEPLSWRRDRSC